MGEFSTASGRELSTHLVESRPDVGRLRPNVARDRPNLARRRPTSVEFGRTLVRSGPNLAELGPDQPKSSLSWPKSRFGRPSRPQSSLADVGTDSTKLGMSAQVFPILGQVLSSLAGIVPNSVKVGQHLVEAGHTLTDAGPNLVRGVACFGPSRATFGRISLLGRFRTSVGRTWPISGPNLLDPCRSWSNLIGFGSTRVDVRPSLLEPESVGTGRCVLQPSTLNPKPTTGPPNDQRFEQAPVPMNLAWRPISRARAGAPVRLRAEEKAAWSARLRRPQSVAVAPKRWNSGRDTSPQGSLAPWLIRSKDSALGWPMLGPESTNVGRSWGEVWPDVGPYWRGVDLHPQHSYALHRTMPCRPTRVPEFECMMLEKPLTTRVHIHAVVHGRRSRITKVRDQ